MNGPRGDEQSLVVVLASIDAGPTVRACLDRWLAELEGRGSLVVVDASRDGTAGAIAADYPDVRLLRRPPGRLAPELWRDGLDATDAPLVAFSTLQMAPAAGWRQAMLARLEESGAAVVGGPIEPARGLAALDRAIYLLRYVHYLRPLIDPARAEPPGDNAVYRRDRLAGLESLLGGGFWEVEIHRALRSRGERFALADAAVVVFQGGTGLAALLRQRFEHARRYGASRTRGARPLARLLRLAAAPLVPVVLLRRIIAALLTRGQALADWLPALPGLVPLLAAWSLGEARGIGAGLWTGSTGSVHSRR
jgi:hypothetical protein